jgi:ribosomal protein S18 acetylase RimI-like enzyme
MQVREASPRDEPVISELYVASRREAWRGIVDEVYLDRLNVEEEGRELLTDFAPRDAGWRVLVGEEGGRVVGFVTFVANHESRTGHVGALFVSPDRFRSGIGTSLLHAAVTALEHDGCDEAILWTIEEDWELTAFYRRRGWEPDGGTQIIELDRSRTVHRLRRFFSERVT